MIESPMSQEWRELKDIPLPNDRIEKGIADLVRALTGLGIKTNESCEGHLDKPDGSLHPWVTFFPFPFMYPNALELSTRLARLRQATEDYNSKSPIKWEISMRGYLVPTAKASNIDELLTLQKDASQFANFIFGNHIKPSKQ
ncbi:MAG: hypothetical protein A3D74_03710 [Candidatus Levybacteria bacterium RIFCSPHIGHO2_02_FULL_37_13]|nr:MAG: hypothetical protein A3D74_03710 [Candidatus Levybacteria bacterium RIFCSPHIGHO2_02_FULL_37_13]OGH38227.1 MAG: hypothetical protein A3B41_00040 [Candidatus Levybacteria bacterium RIFCSPLOWO2_01_FULL_37_26]